MEFLALDLPVFSDISKSLHMCRPEVSGDLE